MIAALLLASIGLKAVFDSHNLAEPQMPNLYTLHSWIGLAAVIFCAMQVSFELTSFTYKVAVGGGPHLQLLNCGLVQWLLGFVAFLFPGLRHSLRSSYMPLHVFGGLMIFGLATGAAISGLLEKAIFTKYKVKTSESSIYYGWLICLFRTSGRLTLYWEPRRKVSSSTASVCR